MALPNLPSNIERFIKTYQYQTQVLQEIRNVTRQFRALIPKKETFIFNDGKSQDLLCLDGTIPVRYKGNVYNIPIRIWLLDTHPYHAPLCYVCPTANMQIKVSRYVDESGRVFLPYLHEWNPPGGSDILGVIQVMIMVFMEQSPVFSKPAQTPQQQPPKQTTPYPTNSSYPMPSPGGYPTPSANPGYATNTMSITDEHIRMSLISAVESRITERALEFEQQFKAEEEVLKKTNEELVMGRNKIDSYMNQMGRDCGELENNLTVLKEKNEQLKQAIEQMSDKDKQPDIDGAVTTTAPLYKQLLNAYAEESAVEDTIYYLGEGLRKGVIDLDTFLKHVRELSRKQFMLRALMQKCRQKAGLPPL